MFSLSISCFYKVITCYTIKSNKSQDLYHAPVAQRIRAMGFYPKGRGFESLPEYQMVGVAQLVRAPGCGSGGRGFESHRSPQISILCTFGGWLAFLINGLIDEFSSEMNVKRWHENCDRQEKPFIPATILQTGNGLAVIEQVN